MLDRPKLKRAAGQEVPEPKQGQERPADQRFALKVDGQIKCSFSDKAEALRRGQEIKKSFPVVLITVHDAREGTTELVPQK